jgi:hypothetical protein
MKPGDIVKYIGQSQQGVLAAGDTVELDHFEPLTGKWRVRIFMAYGTYVFHCKPEDLALFDGSLPVGLNNEQPAKQDLNWVEEQRVKRLEAGECVKCGTRRRMSIHGLLPCPSCEPRLL